MIENFEVNKKIDAIRLSYIRSEYYINFIIRRAAQLLKFFL